MKSVVNAVSSITDDIRSFEQNPNRFDISEDTVRHLRERCEATLQNLVSAARNHASSFGLSPVSLMDAAASHVSAAIIDLVRLLLLKRATTADRDARESTRSPAEYGAVANSNGNGNHNYKPSLRSIDETRTKSPHARAPSSGSARFRDEDYGQQRNVSGTTLANSIGPTMSPPPPPSYDDLTMTVGGVSDDSSALAGGDNSWSELKVCPCEPFLIQLPYNPRSFSSHIWTLSQRRWSTIFKTCSTQ